MNKIKTIKTFLMGEANEEPRLHVYEERDQLGNVTLLRQYNYDGDLESKSEFEFDEKGRLIVEKQYSVADVPDQTLKIFYNESGKPDHIDIIYADGSVSTKKYSRDIEQNSTTIDIVDQDGDVEGKEFRRFDSESRILEEVLYTETGAIESKAEFEYDEHGNITESVRVDEEGFETVRFFDYYRDDESRLRKIETLNEDEEVIRVDEFEYDERGNRTKHTMTNVERGSVFVDVRKFDQNDNETHFERLMGNTPIEVVETKYREDGLMESQETRRSEGVMGYKFDYELY